MGEINENKRKQQILTLAGYKVPQDGSWGPWQQSLWDKFNTREKQYKPTVWGLLQMGWDKLLGQTQNKNPEVETIQDTGKTPSTDTRTPEERNKDYWKFGSADRWKASIENDTNPLVGFNRTFVPAIGGAYLLDKAPAVVQLVKNPQPIINGIKNFTTTKEGFIKVAKPLAKSLIGGTAVNEVSKDATGKTWGENVSPYLGISTSVGEFTNPGYFAGGVPFGISSRYRQFKNFKNFAEDVLNINKTTRGHYRQAYHDLTQKLEDINNQIDHLSNPPVERIRNNWAWKNFKEFWGQIHSPEFRGGFSKVVSGQFDKIPINSGNYSSNSVPIIFSDQTGNTVTSQLKINDFANDYVAGKIAIHKPYDNAISSTKDLINYVKVPILKNSLLSPIFEGNIPEVQQGITNYVNQLNTVLGEDGTVAGSLVHYKNGILKGTSSNSGTIIGPADTEIYTTEDRLPSLMQKLQFTERALNSIGGRKGTSPFTFRNNDSAHRGVDTEINVIGSDKDGFATGKLAHQIYRAIYPEQYSQMLYDAAMKGVQVSPSKMSLPITPENLLQFIRKDPELMQKHLLTDLVGQEIFTKSNNLKANKRLFTMLFDEDPEVAKQLNSAIKTMGTYNMGSQFKLGSELYPNLDLTNIEANKNFLMRGFNLPEATAERLASNPNVMKNAVDQYNFAYTTGVRLVNNNVVKDLAATGELLRNPQLELFDGNASFGGGGNSGRGLNTALLNPEGGWSVGTAASGFSRNLTSITQHPLTFYPEKFKTPMDLVNQVERLSQLAYSLPWEDNLVVDPSNRAVPHQYKLQRIQEIEQAARDLDAPIVFNSGYEFGYKGGMTKPIAAGLRFSTRDDLAELGSLLKAIKDNQGTNIRTVAFNDLSETARKSLEPLISSSLQEVDDFFNTWKNASLKDKRLLLLHSNNYGMNLANSEDALRPSKFNEFSIPEEISRNISNLYKELNGRKPINLSKETAAKPESATSNEPTIPELNRKLTQYFKEYKAAKKALYEYDIKYRQLRKQDRQLTKLKSEIMDRQDNFYWKSRWQDDRVEFDSEKAKDEFKNYIIKLTSAIASIALLSKFIDYKKSKNLELNWHAAGEKYGYEDPNNGWYEVQLYRNARGTRDRNEYNDIDAKVDKAKQLYELRQQK